MIWQRFPAKIFWLNLRILGMIFLKILLHNIFQLYHENPWTAFASITVNFSSNHQVHMQPEKRIDYLVQQKQSIKILVPIEQTKNSPIREKKCCFSWNRSLGLAKKCTVEFVSELLYKVAGRRHSFSFFEFKQL